MATDQDEVRFIVISPPLDRTYRCAFRSFSHVEKLNNLRLNTSPAMPALGGVSPQYKAPGRSLHLDFRCPLLINCELKPLGASCCL